MNHSEGLPIFELGKKFGNQPSKKLAWKIIKKYFRFYDEKGTTDALWEMVVEIMNSDSENITGTDRNNVLFFYEYVTQLNKALFYLCELKDEKNKAFHTILFETKNVA